MKIAYIGSFKYLYDEQGIALALEELGHSVERYAEDNFTFETIAKILASKPDFLLFAKLKIDLRLRGKLLEHCKKHKVKTVCWMPDLYFGLGRQFRVDTKDPIFLADFVCSPDGGNDEQWKAREINHHLLRQGIPLSETSTGASTTRPFDIVFVGSQNPEFKYRQELLRRLREKYQKRFQWYGRDYTHEVRGSDLNDLYASVKVVIGDSVYSPHYWSNRVYETLGRGGFLIHPRIPGLDKEFRYYDHLVPYDYGDFDGLFEKIDYYLEHDDERLAIQKSGHKIVAAKYTIIHRVKELLHICTQS